jgi:competence protein ComEA
MRTEPASSSHLSTRRRERPPRAATPERSAHLAAARLKAWAPLLMRALACGLALVGLAGIGLAAAHSPELGGVASPQAMFPQAMFDAAGMSRALTPRRAAPLEAGSAPAGSPPVGSAPAGSAAGPPAPAPPATAPPANPCPGALSGAAPADVPAAEAGLVGAEAAPAFDPKREQRVILNQASALELQRLPGVGPKRAEAIIQLRSRLGRFRRPNDLLRIKGIGPRTLQRMLPELVLDPA